MDIDVKPNVLTPFGMVTLTKSAIVRCEKCDYRGPSVEAPFMGRRWLMVLMLPAIGLGVIGMPLWGAYVFATGSCCPACWSRKLRSHTGPLSENAESIWAPSEVIAHAERKRAQLMIVVGLWVFLIAVGIPIYWYIVRPNL